MDFFCLVWWRNWASFCFHFCLLFGINPQSHPFLLPYRWQLFLSPFQCLRASLHTSVHEMAWSLSLGGGLPEIVQNQAALLWFCLDRRPHFLVYIHTIMVWKYCPSYFHSLVYFLLTVHEKLREIQCKCLLSFFCLAPPATSKLLINIPWASSSLIFHNSG